MIRVETFGCRLNLAESQAMRALGAGLDDVIVVNTCAVTAEAERQARQAIRRLRRENPAARMIVTGCAATIAPEHYAGLEIVANDRKLDPATWIALGARPQPVAGFTDHTRGFVEIQTGCDHRCTFCVIPLGRGPSRSRSRDDVVREIDGLIAQGVREVVLTGVDLTSWREDELKLGDLVRAILARTSIPRLRLSSLDPAEIDDALIETLADPRVMPHVHLSIQAGDDLILKRMKRRHDTSMARAVVDRLRRALGDVALGADVIAGFPTESDAAHARTRDHLAALDVAHLHVFPFSARAETPAARMPAVAPATIKARAADLRALGAAMRRRFLGRRVGARTEILVERDGVSGHDPHFFMTRLDRPRAPGTIVAARITGADDRYLLAAA